MEHVWNMYGQIVEERTKTYNLERYFSLFRTKTSENVCKIHIFDRNFAFLPALHIITITTNFLPLTIFPHVWLSSIHHIIFSQNKYNHFVQISIIAILYAVRNMY